MEKLLKRQPRWIAILVTVFMLTSTVINIQAAQLDTSNERVSLTEEEKAYIEKNPVITIAMDTSWIPYCFYDNKTQEVKGILPNVLDEVAESLGMEVEYIPKDTYQEAINTVNAGDTMLVSGIANDPKAAKRNQVLLTDPYIVINYSLVTKNAIPDFYADGSSYKVAVCTGSYATTLMKEKMPSYEFVEYHNNDECMSAVMKGETDVALVATHSAEYYSTMHQYSELSITMINDFTWGLSFGVNQDVDPMLIELLNKGTEAVPQNIVEQAVYTGLLEATESNHTILNFIYSQPILAIFVVAMIVALLVLIVFMIVLHNRRKNEMQKEQEQLKKVEKALEEAKNANASKNEFFVRMSHDLRTPMNGILGIAELSTGETDLEVLAQNNEKIKRSGQYLLGLINDSLDFQRIDSGKMTIEPEVVYTKDVLENIIDIVRPSAEQKGVELKITNENADLDWYIKIDAMRYKQIIVNLLSNAIKFTPKGGIVELSFECVGREGMISHDIIRVRDTGIGMSPEFLKNGVFKPFSQERNEVTVKYAGSGLGLSIAKNLVERMGGRIEVESELGVGTTFVIYLDFERIEKEDAVKIYKYRERKSKGSYEILKDKQILLVEDHPLNAEIAVKLLERVGCKVTWAENGKKGIEKFLECEKNYFNAILMDIRMPEMDGIEAAKAIRKLDREDATAIPIIAMTANAYDEDVKLSLDAGMNGHLSKPIEPHLLYQVLSDAIQEESED